MAARNLQSQTRTRSALAVRCGVSLLGMRLRVLLLLGLLLVGVGCSRAVRWPNLYHPGTADYQRAVAEQYDPYPSPDEGPEILGGRPPGFQRPLKDTEWGRRYARPDGAIQPLAAPQVFGPAPAVTSPWAPPPATFPPVASPPSLPFSTQQRSPY